MTIKQTMKTLILGLGLIIRLTSTIYGLTDQIDMSTLLYSSYRAKNNTAGQKISVKLGNKLLIESDFESYLNQYKSGSFIPSMINYGLTIQYKNMGWTHYCLHDIDTYEDLSYPVKNQFYVVW